MTPEIIKVERREQLIAALLWYGTWLASCIIAAGMMLGVFHQYHGVLPGWFVRYGFNSYSVIKSGVALFIFLPVARVALMLVIFLREHDYLYMAISALVLTIIALGIVLKIPG